MEGSDLLIVLALVALLFGASQLPKFARALGSASHEFKRGTEEGTAAEAAADRATEAATNANDGTKETVAT
jgi:sec-independent protein translocase protein TatA